MIILISGESCTGKTKLAHELMCRFNIPYLSIDIVMMGLFRNNTNCGYTPMDSVYKINQYVWPIIKEMIKTNIENNTTYIYEGFQIRPSTIKQFEPIYSSKIIPVFLGYSSEYIKNNYTVIKEMRGIIENRNDLDSLNKMILKNKILQDECEAENFDFSCIKNEYTEDIKSIINNVGIKLGKCS